jgi:hypothetical protein
MASEDQLADAERIDLDNDYELQYWTSQLKVTNDELRRAVEEVGNRIEDVKIFLERA